MVRDAIIHEYVNVFRMYGGTSCVTAQLGLLYTDRGICCVSRVLCAVRFRVSGLGRKTEGGMSFVFKQTASHIPHEGNSEQMFSRSGALSDDNGKMDPLA